jgi:hypothetical protein
MNTINYSEISGKRIDQNLLRIDSGHDKNTGLYLRKFINMD